MQDLIDLAPLFLALPTLFVSLKLTNAISEFKTPSLAFYAVSLVQSAFLSSLLMLVVAILAKLGDGAPSTKEVKKSVQLSIGRQLVLFGAISLIFLADQLLCPARFMNLVILALLLSGPKDDHMSAELEETYAIDNKGVNHLIRKHQLFIIYLLSFLSDVVIASINGQDLMSLVLMYALLLIPIFVFLKPSADRQQSSTCGHLRIQTSGLLLLLCTVIMLSYNFESYNLKMIFVTAGSLTIFTISQLDVNHTNPINQVFNTSLFLTNYKRNIIILNTVMALILQTTTDSDNKMEALKMNIVDFAINMLLMLIVNPAKKSEHSSCSETVSDKSHPNSTFVSLVVQLFNSKDTRSIFNFLLLNVSFMFIQLLYSFRSKSLSLLSDSLHMMLDCTSLFLGLLASLIAKNNKQYPTREFPFGLTRIETLAGFTNGSLLLGVVFGILNESFQRLFHPVDLRKTDELLIVSILGLVVNLVGIFAFNHGHDGSHGHSHSHSHSHEHTHQHTHNHSESGEHAPNLSDNMHGIFLHILADTLGSVGVILSTLIVKLTGIQVIDPIASIFIALLILVSSIPLLKSSSSNLLLASSDSSVSELQYVLGEVLKVPGVRSYTTPRFWPVSDTNSKLTGYIHIQYYRTETSLSLRSKIDKLFKSSKSISKIYIQYENEIDDCWCRKDGIFSVG
ncbi:hypothetical protein KL905_001332 [Ogataea polymorpha]|nr:hypothetical protein KL937_002723 [Ogataea polymorpha]KAG7896925.1 hypothetical protein KL908_000327 [Ogataea polymorpha]KAG7912124.1 hypothetical protein KL906_000328 [Ogataea polymorpha]KAG7913304.1 hypothetical protein KL907_000249 [Ogataea polymorpha]KAG7920112.1 hypothetical protein KL927_000792 [Ogataea polymorpha]